MTGRYQHVAGVVSLAAKDDGPAGSREKIVDRIGDGEAGGFHEALGIDPSLKRGGLDGFHLLAGHDHAANLC